MIYKDPIEATAPALTYTRLGAATAWRKDGTLAEFAPNVPRITDAGVTIEGQRTNLDPWSRNAPTVFSAGTLPPTVDGDVVFDGRRCVATTFPTVETGGYAMSRSHTVTGVPITAGVTYVWGVSIKLSRPLISNEHLYMYYTGHSGIGGAPLNITSAAGLADTWKRFSSSSAAVATGVVGFVIYATKLLSPITVYSTDRQLETGTRASTPIITTGTAAMRGTDRLYAADAIPKNDFTLLWETECAAPADVSNWSLASDASVEAIVGGNQGFEEGLTGWASRANVTSWMADASTPTYLSSFEGRAHVAKWVSGAYGQAFMAKRFPIDTSRKYIIRGRAWASGAGASIRIAIQARNGAEVEIPGAYQYRQYSFTSLGAGWMEIATPVISGEGGLLSNFTAGTKAIQIGILSNVLGAAVETALDGIWLEDVTESEAAKILPAETIQISVRTPSSGTPISQRRRHALRKRGSVLTEYLNGVPIKNSQGYIYSNLLIGGEGLEPINGIVEAVKIMPYALTDKELIKLTSLNDTTFDHLSPGGVYYYDAGQTATPRKSQVVVPTSSGRKLIL